MKKKNLVFVIIFPLIAIFLYAVMGHFLFRHEMKLNSNSEAESEIKSSVVTFDAGEGSAVEPVEVVNGQIITTVPATTRDGYKFDGWYLDARYTQKFDFATEIQSDLTLYAKWREVYTVSFETCGGTTLNNVTVDKNEIISAPTTTRSGYEFIGWYTNASYTQKYNFSTPVASNLKLYARWAYILTENDCTFELASDGESYGITHFSGSSTELVIIPRTYNNLPVTFIGTHTFEDCTNLRALIIPNNIVTLKSYAFLGWENSQTIYCEISGPADEWTANWNKYCNAKILWNGQW
ncbi:MAG: InlB B-repeat-containing protein [Clostridia bacterium]|nr:InlB B-repeat-containing protein [Clostridia bacterium]